MTRPSFAAKRATAALCVAAAVLCSTAGAQTSQRANVPTDTDTLVTAGQLQSILQQAAVSKETGKPGEVSTQLFPGAASCSFIRLNEPDLPHVHPVSEIYVIQSGSGTLETGGTMIGPFTNGGVHHQSDAKGNPSSGQQTAPVIGPDHGGTALTGGRTEVVKAGDVILVPAGVNHHWTRVDQPLVYLDIKFPKAEAR
jgi:mannose-6-phosphate isomerase-like protein (cupin superfamily)